MDHKMTISGRGQGHVTQFPNFGTPHNFWMNQAIRFKFSTKMEDHKITPSGHGRGHVTQFWNFGTPYNFWMNRAIGFKFGTEIEDGPHLHRDHKTIPMWAWSITTFCSNNLESGIVTNWPNFQILGPPHNFWMNQAICFKFGTEMEDEPSLHMDHKTILSGRDRGHITQFWESHITSERIELSASNLLHN